MKNTISLFIFIMLACISCNSQKNVVNKYYVLELTQSHDSLKSRHPEIDHYLEIVPVVIAEAYAGQEIVNRSQSNEIIYYAYHHWANRPQASFERMIEKYFDGRHIFKDTELRFWNVTANYRLETEIYHLELIRDDAQLTAHISMEFNLLEQSSGEKLITHSADRYEQLATKEMNLFAATISKIFREELTELHSRIKQHFLTSQVNSQ